jgi:hypothetical protein
MPPGTPQQEVYMSGVKDVVDDVLKGYNGTVGVCVCVRVCVYVCVCVCADVRCHMHVHILDTSHLYT